MLAVSLNPNRVCSPSKTVSKFSSYLLTQYEAHLKMFRNSVPSQDDKMTNAPYGCIYHLLILTTYLSNPYRFPMLGNSINHDAAKYTVYPTLLA
jgi:hypothetical protein